MTDNVKKLTWAELTSNGGGVPERMTDLEFVKVTDILDEESIIEDYETYKSNKDGAQGVHIALTMCADGRKVRVCTRAVSLVRMFNDVDEDAMRALLNERHKTKFTKVKTSKGFEAVVLAPVDEIEE